MKAVSPTRVVSLSVESLGLDSTAVDLSTVEAAACALRRAGCVCIETCRCIHVPVH